MNLLKVIVLLTACLLVSLLSAQDISSLKFKSKEARDAVRSYVRAGDDAVEEFEKAREAATESLINELNTVFEKEKSDGDLDEALKLRKALEQLGKETPRSKSGTEAALVGKWTIQYPEYTHLLEISRRGTKLNYVLAHGPDHARKDSGDIVIEGGYFLLRFGRKAVARCHLHRGRLYVEFWVDSGDVDSSKFPDHFAIGTKTN